ncbi:MAG: substrate-binding domain-containing protein [Planctomycetota bacterium]
MYSSVLLTCVLLGVLSNARAEEGRRIALLISVRETREPRLHRLWFSDDDIRGLAAVLPNFGFSQNNITILTQHNALDTDVPDAISMRSNIRAGVKKLCKEARPDDTILIAFSGHGVQLRRDGRIYLCPPETTLADTSTMIALDDILREMGPQCKAKLKLMMVDACRNDPTDPRPDITPRASVPDLPLNVALYLSCSKGQQSLETGKVLHGIFFHHIIQGLSGAARDVNGDITLKSLEDLVAREVPMTRLKYSPKSRTIQTPEFHTSIRERIVLGRVENAEPMPISIRGQSVSPTAALYTQWTTDFNKANPGTKVDFHSGGFTGIKALNERTALVVATDSKMSPTELFGQPEVIQIPSVSTAVVPIFNLQGIQNVTLDATTFAEIYLGRIVNWNDPKIATINPGIVLPDRHIIVVHPADETQPGRIVSDFLRDTNPDWAAKQKPGQKVNWPIGAAGNGTPDIARIVKYVEGAIAFVELEFVEKAQKAIQKDSPVTTPSTITIITNKVSDEPRDPFPIRGTTYLSLFRDLSYIKDRKQAENVVTFLRWCYSDGMKSAGPTFGALKSEYKNEVEEALKSISIDGSKLAP